MNEAAYELTMMYLQNQDISQYSPKQLAEKFNDTYAEIEQFLSDDHTEKSCQYSDMLSDEKRKEIEQFL